MESNSAVVWILAFDSFVDTQRSFVVFECLVKFALIIILNSFAVKLINFFNSALCYLSQFYLLTTWIYLSYIGKAYLNFTKIYQVCCRIDFQLSCPLLHDIDNVFCYQCCTIEAFVGPISFVNAYYFKSVSKNVDRTPTLPIRCIDII
jgi:hypothetical protein